MKNKTACILLILNSLLVINSSSQTIAIDAGVETAVPKKGHLRMGNPGPKGKEIGINSKYLTLGGKPILPVMGEVHFTRVKRENWEDIILKMKANGINIIAFYIFWIHHEEIEGKFNWSGNNDVRAFTELCQKHELWAYPRLGPWCHGEVRNGGLPDWLMKKENIKLRSNDPAYQHYAEQWYKEIAQQLKGLYYKNNGPIIGVQLENEYWRGKKGEEHIIWLKQTAQKYGIDVPLYTVTAWRNASVPENEVLPLWGGYPAAPWNTDLNKIEHNESYLFKMPVNDESIGHKEQNEKYQPDYSPYPYLTCELGVGNQISEHRRPIIDPVDGMAIVTSNIASGSNLPGYYVFAGGLNPVGQLTTLEEDRWETGYWNEYPDISYDFQAAISETGEIKPAYHILKALHYFLNEFGHLVAPMQPIIPTGNDAWDHLQYSFRTNRESGFLFVSNYYRGHTKSTKKAIQFSIQLKKEKLEFPSAPINIEDSTVFIWPVNFQLGHVLLKYSTVQPICNINHGDTIDWYFKPTKSIAPEFCFSDKNFQSIDSEEEVINQNNFYVVKKVGKGLQSPIVIMDSAGFCQRIFVLTEQQTRHFWHLKNGNQEFALLSTANLTLNERGELKAFSTNKEDTITVLSSTIIQPAAGQLIEQTQGVDFKQFIIRHKAGPINLKFQKSDVSDQSQWLEINTKADDSKKSLYHIQFFKTFELVYTAAIRAATLHTFSDLKGKLRVNDQWVNQMMDAGKLNRIDLTGYLNKGKNQLMFDFPYKKQSGPFKAVLEVEFYNSDKIWVFTDTTWTISIQYQIPAPWDKVKAHPVTINRIITDNHAALEITPNRYQLQVQQDQFKDYSNVYLRVNYEGNKAQFRIGNKLVADNFNNGTTWSINLKTIGLKTGEPLIFEFEPLQKGYQIYFEKEPDAGSIGTVKVSSVHIQPEYESVFYLK